MISGKKKQTMNGNGQEMRRKRERRRRDEGRGKGGTNQNPMIKLNGRRVLEHVPPPRIALVGASRVSGIVEFGEGRNDAFSHVGELVVDQAGVEAGDEGACEGGKRKGEREGGEEGRETRQFSLQVSLSLFRVLLSEDLSPVIQKDKKKTKSQLTRNSREQHQPRQRPSSPPERVPPLQTLHHLLHHHASLRMSQVPFLPRGKSGVHHSNVEGEGGSEMSGEAVLGHSRGRVGSVRKVFGVETGGDHVPSEGSLRTPETRSERVRKRGFEERKREKKKRDENEERTWNPIPPASPTTLNRSLTESLPLAAK